MTRDTRELALATALQAFSKGAILKDDILTEAAKYETYLEGPTGSAGSDQPDRTNHSYSIRFPDAAYDTKRTVQQTPQTFTQEELNQAGISNWNAALEELRDVVSAEDHWPWRDRLAAEIERLKR